MKTFRYIAGSLLAVAMLSACKEEYDFPVTDVGPTMKIEACDASAYMGGKINFTVSLNDPIALSTLKAELLFDEDVVGELTLRTKENGSYDGEVAVPYYKDIPDGDATMRFTGQNIHFGTSVVEQKVAVSRPDFASLTFVLDEQEYTMERVKTYEYAVTAAFPAQAKGYIKTPAIGGGEEYLTFGWSNGAVDVGTTEVIPFSNTGGGEYTITFNTLTFAAGPFMKIQMNGSEMTMIDEQNYRIVASLATGDALTFEGLADYDDFWIDPDFFEKQADGSLKFLPVSGTYGITANLKYNYLIAEVYSSGAPATLQDDGSGAIWVIGEGIGKPSIGNEVGWSTDKALCMAPIADGVYRITGIGGMTMKSDAINFKFYHQKGWGGEFGASTLSCTSDLVFVGDGNGATDDKPARDNGNLGLYVGKSFEMGVLYQFTVDVTAGIDKAVLTVEEAGQAEIPSQDIFFAGVKLAQVDADNYSALVELSQGETVEVEGISDLSGWWVDTNYFEAAGGAAYKSLVVGGTYKVKANTASKLFSFSPATADGSDAVMAEDGSGALWLMGWGVGYPSQDSQFGWNPGAAYAMAEISPAVYRMTGTAGPEHGSALGDYFRCDYIDVKYFHQNDWGGEMLNPVLTAGTEALLKCDGNLDLADGVQLEEGAVYELTIDLTKATMEDGKSVGAEITFVKK